MDNNLGNKGTQAQALVKVNFHGDDLIAVSCDGKVWVSIRRVCEALEINIGAQQDKLREKAWATIRLIRTVANDVKDRELACIDLDALPMWLATIEPNRVAPSVRPKLERYQLECARVLREHFMPAIPEQAERLQRNAKEAAAEERDRRLFAREERLRRAFEHKVLTRLATKLKGKVSDENMQALEMKAAEVATGQSLTFLMPPANGGWKTPTEIAVELGVTANRIGRIIADLGLKGPGEQGLPNVSEAYHNTAKGTHRDVTCFRYGPTAVSMIRARLEAPSKESTANDGGEVVPLFDSDAG